MTPSRRALATVTLLAALTLLAAACGDEDGAATTKTATASGAHPV